MRSRGGKAPKVSIRALLLYLCVFGALVAFSAWSIALVVSVRQLRTAVEVRVGCLSVLSRAQAEVDGTNPETSASAARDIARLAAEMDRERQTDPALAEAFAGAETELFALAEAGSDRERLKQTRAAIDRLIALLRKQTGELSRQLGERWTSLYTLVGASLVLATTTSLMVVYLRTIRIARAERERELAQEKLRQADRLVAVGTLAAAVAHEINNPLTFVLLNLKLLKDRLAEQPQLAELSDEALNGVQRVAAIVRDLRQFAHQDEGALDSIDVGAALERSLKLFMPALHAGTKLTCDLADVPRVRGVARRLEQVFLNLLLNANHAMAGSAPGAARLQISVACDAEGAIVARIADNGTGLAEEVKKRLFEPFVSSKPLGEGTGLGLFVCQGIIHAMDGKLELVDNPDGGTIATVTLPPEQRRSETRVVDVAVEAKPTSGRLSVVVIDDEPSIRKVLERILVDHEVASYASAELARPHLVAQPVDVVFCDVSLPGVDGIELYRQACRERPELAARFVFMTGGSFSESATEFLAATDNACLDKPFNRAAVLSAISRVTGGGRAAPPTRGKQAS